MTADDNNDIITVLHVSDFHFSGAKRRDQKIVVDALIKDLQEICIGYRKPDVIMFTGDLVQAAGLDLHDDAYDFLLSPVATAVGLSDERIFIAPGNHDVETEAVEVHLDLHHEWRKMDDEKLNEAYASGSFRKVAAEKFKSYFDLEAYLSTNSNVYSNDFGTVHCLPEIGLDIVTFNTAILSKGGSKNLPKDEGEMAIPEFAVLELCEKLTQKFCIAVTHHPFQSMNEQSAKLLRRHIQSKSSIHLFGHMHDPSIENIQAMEGNVYSSQAGAIFTHRKNYYIGYSIISYSKKTGSVETVLRRYYSDRSAFDADIGRVPGGIFYPTPESRKFWREQVTPFDEESLKLHISEVGPVEIFLNRESAESEKEILEHFVAPPIIRQFSPNEVDEDKRDKKNSSVTVDEIVSGRGNEIVIAAPEHGRTMLLRHLQAVMHTRQQDRPNLPIFIDYSDLRTNFAATIKLIKSNAISLPDGVDVEGLMALGYCTILVDDVDFSSLQKVKVFREVLSRYPKCRYILSAPKKDIFSAGNISMPEMPLHFGALEVCALGRRQMRKLVRKLNPEANQDILLEKLHSEFTQMNLPFTAANGTILMEIYEAFPDFKAINRSVVIEQFVDATLRKAAEDQVRRETFDFNNKTSLLASIASWMSFEDDYKPIYESLRAYVSSYLDDLGLIASVDDLLREFFNARILVRRSEGRVTFRYRSVLEYFISLHMVMDSVYRDWIMDPQRYLQYVNEIQFYAGKMRGNAELINLISTRFVEILDEAYRELPLFDIEKITQLTLPSGSDETSIESISDQLQATPMTEDEKDQELEAELPRDVEDRQEVFRPQIADLGSKLLVSLFLYSGVLKNLESIKDIEKRRHLSLVLRGWSFFLGISLVIVPELARKRKYKLNGVSYTVNAPKSMSNNDLARLIALSLPTGISSFIKSSLGTEKLERQLAEPTLSDKADPLIYEFFRVSLIADLRLSETPRAISDFIKACRQSDYLRQSIIWKVKETRRLNGFDEVQFAKIVPIISGAIADAKGGSKKKRVKEKSDQIQNFKKQSILMKMRRIEDDRSDN
ncbi:metallophosphoesterase [Phaeovulum sp. NW3]|uniref:metallophosphoesterase n=1 Tax=Phaeovulum sp. NW3 TaxID=2934933 RepID=UPI0020212A37|nr:metallophosphoesterase [Phaeovulum sp. NW3]MCL7466751.1 metallophosphoesterase [Phaeovulum sp. NW3]